MKKALDRKRIPENPPKPKDPYLKRCKAPEYIRRAWRDWKMIQRQRSEEKQKPKSPRRGR